MAKKGQKFNKYSDALRKEVVSKYMQGKGSYKSLSEEYEIPYFTINGWITKYKNGHDLSSKHHLKGRSKEKDIDYKEKYEILKKYQTFLKAQREKK